MSNAMENCMVPAVLHTRTQFELMMRVMVVDAGTDKRMQYYYQKKNMRWARTAYTWHTLFALLLYSVANAIPYSVHSRVIVCWIWCLPITSIIMNSTHITQRNQITHNRAMWEISFLFYSFSKRSTNDNRLFDANDRKLIQSLFLHLNSLRGLEIRLQNQITINIFKQFKRNVSIEIDCILTLRQT